MGRELPSAAFRACGDAGVVVAESTSDAIGDVISSLLVSLRGSDLFFGEGRGLGGKLMIRGVQEVSPS